MIKNFNKDNNFISLRTMMGISQDYKSNFTGLEINEYGFKLNQSEIEKLKTGGDVDIKISQLDYTDKDPILRVGKVNVVLYIRDQFYPSKNEYKYHISWCDTLEERKQNNKISRYVITRKNDELFNVNLSSIYTHEITDKNKLMKMSVCRGCLRKLNYKGYAKSSISEKNKIYESFSLEQFLEEFNTGDFVPKGVKIKSEYNQAINEYPPNWPEISRKYREKVRWTCESCGKKLHSKKYDLDVHHKNSNKFDVSDSNLIALCKHCHEKEHQLY